MGRVFGRSANWLNKKRQFYFPIHWTINQIEVTRFCWILNRFWWWVKKKKVAWFVRNSSALTRNTPARCFISSHMTEARGPDKENSRGWSFDFTWKQPWLELEEETAVYWSTNRARTVIVRFRHKSGTHVKKQARDDYFCSESLKKTWPARILQQKSE